MDKRKIRIAKQGKMRVIDRSKVASTRIRQVSHSSKEKIDRANTVNESSGEEYATNRVEERVSEVTQKTANRAEVQGRKAIRNTKENMLRAKDQVTAFKEKRAETALKKQQTNRTFQTRNPSNMPNTKAFAESVKSPVRKGVEPLNQSKESIKQSAKVATKSPNSVKVVAKGTGKRTIKFAEKGSLKAVDKSAKSGIKTAKVSMKTSAKTAKATKQTAQASIKATQRAAQVARASAKATVAGTRVTIRATNTAAKAIAAAIRALVSAIVAGGWVAVLVIIIICLIGALISSPYGIFFSGEESETGETIQDAITAVNQDYQNKLNEIKSSVDYDHVQMSGTRAPWKDVLALYAVKVSTDSQKPQEIATVDEGKKELLKTIFWQMHQFRTEVEFVENITVTESIDAEGNLVTTEVIDYEVYLYITVLHKTVDEMIDQYRFDIEEKEILNDLLSAENNELWESVLYGIQVDASGIVEVGLSQVGNVGGQPYWSWYGFNGRVEWCACFVSWCANQMGYIDAGIIPKFASCMQGAWWFQGRGQWADRYLEPVPGTIIFFDWNGDGWTEHVGIVEKCEGGRVYTVEGNSGDACRTRSYPVGSGLIYGYGLPAY